MTLVKVLGRYIITLFAASVIIFLLMRAVPGNPARVALGVNATEESVAELTTTMGLDRPLLVQYGDWMGGLLTGNFGTSLSSQQDITAQVLDRAQVSLILVVTALLLALAIAIPVGMWTARRNGNVDATVVTALTQVGIAIPNFLVGIVLTAFFAINLGWLPANGWSPPNQGFGTFFSHLLMPVVALALVQGAILSRYVRSAILDVLDQDFIRTARALGQSPSQALWRHGLRNAALPVLTVAGLQFTTLIVGAVVIEAVFVIPGLGSMLLDAVSVRDLTTVQSLVMLLVAFTLTINALTDAAYRFIDPRLREGAQS